MSRVAVLAEQALACTVYTRRKRANSLFHLLKDDGIYVIRKVGYNGLLESIIRTLHKEKA